MTSWDERIGASGAWGSVDRLRAAVEDLESRQAGNGALVRPRHLAVAATARLKALDPDLAFDELLQNVGARADTLDTQVAAHLEPAEGVPPLPVEELRGAEDQFAQAILWLPPAGQDEQVALADAYRRDLEGLHSQVSTWLEESRASVRSTAEAHQAATTTNEEAAGAINAKLAELGTTLETMSANVTSFIADRQVEATEAAAAATRATEEVLNAAKAAFTAETERQTTTHASAMTTQTDESTALIGQIDELKTRAEKLVGAVGRTGLSGGYQQWEKSERSAANWMRGVALFLGILTAVAVLFLLGERAAREEEGEDVDVALAIGALAVPGALGGVAAYAGREASKHRRNQVIARRTELELASFEAYMANLTDDEQRELIRVFAPVFFGRANDSTSSKDDDGPQTMTKDLIDQMSSLVREGIKPTA